MRIFILGLQYLHFIGRLKTHVFVTRVSHFRPYISYIPMMMADRYSFSLRIDIPFRLPKSYPHLWSRQKTSRIDGTSDPKLMTICAEYAVSPSSIHLLESIIHELDSLDPTFLRNLESIGNSLFSGIAHNSEPSSVSLHRDTFEEIKNDLITFCQAYRDESG